MSIAFSSNTSVMADAGRIGDEATIGEIAREFDVSLRTLRFYEDRGLLRPRRHGASRFYSVGDRNRLRTILKGKRFGFTLTEIRDLLIARDGGDEVDIEDALGDQQIVDQISHLERQRDELDAAIGRLRATKSLRSASHAAE
jgi:DNA-binding transcriptional MerR regulator